MGGVGSGADELEHMEFLRDLLAYTRAIPCGDDGTLLAALAGAE